MIDSDLQKFKFYNLKTQRSIVFTFSEKSDMNYCFIVVKIVKPQFIRRMIGFTNYVFH